MQGPEDCWGVEEEDQQVVRAAQEPSDSLGSPVVHSREAVARSLAADTEAGHNPAVDTPGDSPVADTLEAFLEEGSHNPEAACIPEDSPAADKGNLGDSPVVDNLEALVRVARFR